MATYGAENPPGESWRIRIKLSGLTVYVVSSTEPMMLKGSPDNPDGPMWVAFDAIPEYGDEIGYIDWSQVQLISWRYSNLPPE